MGEFSVEATGFERKKRSTLDIYEMYKNFQKMALGGDIKPRKFLVFGDGYPNGPTVSDGAQNSLTGSKPDFLK